MNNTTPEQPAAQPFDPRTLPLFTLRDKQGRARGQHMEVKYRLVWLRADWPDAKLSTNLEELTDGAAVFSARIELPNGACATGWGSETAADFKDFIEKAETKALGRACAVLGFGTQFALEYVGAGDEQIDRETGEISQPKPQTPSPSVEESAEEPASAFDIQRAINLWGECGQPLSALEQYCHQRYARDLPLLSVDQCAQLIERLTAKLKARPKP